MFLDGLRLGLLWQLVIGPICLMVFNTASSLGFSAGALMALAVTLVDGLYIFLAAIGVAVFLQSERVKKTVRVVGSVVLILFGLDIITGALGVSLLPQIALFKSETESVFLKAAFMTASNPLTIIFWGGVFSTNVASKNMNGKQVFLFGAGCVSATFTYLNCVAWVGSAVKTFLPGKIIMSLNVVIGTAIILFALKMAGLFKKGEKI
ncbi:amino acid transporter [Synergistales bacterium]|nr:amino acid transporter [Synergistales bacterium]